MIHKEQSFFTDVESTGIISYSRMGFQFFISRFNSSHSDYHICYLISNTTTNSTKSDKASLWIIASPLHKKAIK